MCYEKLKSATIALIFPCHQHNAREMWAKYSLQPRPWNTTDFDHRPKKTVKIFENIATAVAKDFESMVTASMAKFSGRSYGFVINVGQV